VRSFIFALFLFTALGPAWAGSITVLDGVAAQVGEKVVLYSEIFQLSAPTEQRMRAGGASDADIAALRADVLERLIERRLIEELIDRNNIEASDAEVDEAIQGIASENQMTVEELRQRVVEGGMNFDVYRDQIREEIKRAQVINSRVRSQVEVDEQQVRKLYEERFKNQPEAGEMLRLEQLLVHIDRNQSREGALALIEQARACVEQGGNFKTCAEQIPDVHFTNLDWLHADQLADWMNPAVSETKPGQMTQPLISDFGCVILRVIERRHFEPVTYEQAKVQLFNELYDQQMERVYREWMEMLRKQAYIDRKDLSDSIAVLQDNKTP